jgi:aminopeptidase-like protein
MLINFFCPNDWHRLHVSANKENKLNRKGQTHPYFSNEHMIYTIKKNKPKENVSIKSTPPLLKETAA